MFTEVPVRFALTGFAATAVLLGQTSGIPVRPAPADYATRNVVEGITVAASVVPPDQLRKLFSKDLSHEGYVVIEVAVYPAPGKELDLTPDEFTLRVGENGAFLPSQTPAQIAAGDKKSRPPSTTPPQLPDNVHVYQTATIGYESRGNGQYGRQGGVYTGTSTTVGVGNAPYPPGPYPDPRYPPGDPRNYPPGGYPPSQPPTPRGAKPDWTALKTELESKELPSGRISAPVAGYLYFLKPPAKDRKADHELIWLRTAGQIRLAIPAPK